MNDKAFTAGFHELARIPLTTERTLVVSSSEAAFSRPALQLMLDRPGRTSIHVTVPLDKLAELRRAIDLFEERARAIEAAQDEAPTFGRGRPRGRVAP